MSQATEAQIDELRSLFQAKFEETYSSKEGISFKYLFFNC